MSDTEHQSPENLQDGGNPAQDQVPDGESAPLQEQPSDGEQAPAETALTTTNPEKKMKKVKRVKKRRAARIQVDPATFKPPAPEASGTIFNIWYNKWSGGDRDVPVQFAAPNRCDIEKDAGYTLADSISGSYFCLYFARGICTKGRDCEYLHRLPGIHDIFNPNMDCFGRDKFSDYRDDMGGVGSFMRQNRTLYIGRIHVTDDIEEIVARHFAEWGQVERTRVLNQRGVAFVTYSNLANSEFAKEAMAHQSLDNGEVLNVRWATMDPNPAAQKREARMIEEQAAEAIRRALPPDYVAELEGRGVDSRKKRKTEGNFGLEGYEAPDDVWFAKEKAEWIAQQRGLPSGSAASIEGDVQHTIEPPPGQQDQQDLGGILSGSTLAALKARTTSTPKVAFTTAKQATSSGPLVAYGSDDDSD
ncbi:pre-mRNA-splicing factor cwc2 [Microthyrium microscopicum]|uniref:Pre-mRNA-splicing factor CWC2 n=1 Tax=Microthyrium microscopicum TaxID=703497 RepID=A0A6A6UAR3_9PEZI|nr:pre-mRNA-splicing factor cwc2 [Microthyrium microscopicum]